MVASISNNLNKKLEKVSEIFGYQKEELIERALYYYLNTLKEMTNLKNEFLEWDKLSDEALINFEGKIAER